MNSPIPHNGALRIVFNLVLLSLLCIPITTLAQFSFVTNADNTIRITGYTGPAGGVTIPDMTNGYPITSIGNSAFNGQTGVTRVTLPDSITNIGNFAFAFCSGMTNVALGSNVLNIGTSAFQNCVKLRQIVLSDSLTNVGSMAFQSCSALTNVIMGTNVLVIGDSAFRSCSSLTNIFSIGRTVLKIGSAAFVGCSLTAFTVDDANPVFSEESGVLFNKDQTVLIRFPGAGAGSYVVPNSVVTIGDWAFSECTRLTNVLISATVTNLGSQGFSKCTKLASINIPDGVTHIGEWTFYQCQALTGIVFPDSLTSIGAEAFAASGLTNVMIPDSVTEIGIGAFEATQIKSVTVGIGVTAISFGMFQNCPSLTNVILPDSLTYIGDYAFAECKSLSSITIPSSVTLIDGWAFFHCTGLRSIYFFGDAPTLGDFALGGLSAVFPPVVYFKPGTKGWSSTFSGFTTRFIFLPNPVILSDDGTFGVRTSGFGFTIAWATNASIVIESCTNLGSLGWQPVQTNELVADSVYFSDPESTNYPHRFYRVRLHF
jgi:Leucine Rich Repeat (LRR) protein